MLKKMVSSVALVTVFSTAACMDNDGNPPPLTGGNPPPTAGGAPAPAVTTDPNDPMAPPPRPGPGMAMVRVIHASADAPNVDVYVKGQDAPVVTALAYGTTSAWLEVPKGSYTFEVRAAPSTVTDPVAYVTSALAIGDGAMVSAVAAGLLASSDEASAFRVLPLLEEFFPVPAGKVRVRAVHAGADAPAVDLDVGNDNPAIAEVPELARFQDTGAAGIALPANTALALGIAKTGARVTSFTTPPMKDGGQALLIATGLLSASASQTQGFSLLAIGTNGSLGFIKQDPLVYALHASPDAPRVDIFAGTKELVSNLGFGELSAPLRVAPGETSLAFYGTAPGAALPAGAPAATATTGALERGERYLAVATGFLGSAEHGRGFRLQGFRDEFPTTSDVIGAARLRAVHLSPDAAAVDIGKIEANALSPVIFKDLTFTTASGADGAVIHAGDQLLGVTPTGQASTIVASFTVPVGSGQRAFTIAAGALAPAVGQQGFRFLVVDTKPTPWTVATVLPH